MAKVHPMKSMALSEADALDIPIPMPGMDKPRFPYGLRISLEDAQLAELGLCCDDCTVGGVIHLHALARITSVSSNDTDSGKRERVELQIESMCCVESEEAENEMAEEEMEREPMSVRRRNRLYSQSLAKRD